MTKLRVVIDDLREFTDYDPHIEEFETLYFKSSDAGLVWLVKFAMWKVQQEYNAIEELWLDHDLGFQNGDFDTIINIVDWLHYQYDNLCAMPINKVFIHTANSAAGIQMKKRLDIIYDVSIVDANDVYLITKW